MSEEIVINPMPAEKGAKTVAYAIYAIYLFSIIVPFLPIVGIIFAYIFENDARGHLVSHYRFLIRSFWIAILYFTISFASMIFLIGFILTPICYVWWIIRMARGIKSLVHDEAIQYPATWLF
jgi:uncharacterized membrane protein